MTVTFEEKMVKPISSNSDSIQPISKKMINLQKYIASEVRLLKISGFYPQKSPTMMHNFRAFIVMFVIYFAIIHFYLDLNNAEQGPLEFTSCILFVVGSSFVSWKCLAFLKNRRNVAKLEEFLASPILCEFSETNEKIFEAVANSKFFVICKIIGITFTMIVCCLAIKRGMERKSFLSLKVTGSLENNWNCLYHVIFQITYMLLITSHFVLIDVICCKIMSIATATLIILKNNLENVPYENQDFNSLKSILKKNFILHREIIRFTSHIEETFSFAILTIVLSAVYIDCICGIIILIINPSLDEATTFILFFLCVTNQLAIYCWFGEQIMSKSVEIGTGSYMTKWYTADVKIRKYLIIFMERVKKPIIIRAGHFFPLNVRTLTSILRHTYSAFTVMQQFYKDK